MKCNHCGATVREGALYCPICGRPVENSSYHPSEHPAYDRPAAGGRDGHHRPSEPPRHSNSVKWIVAGISVLTVLVIMATVIFVAFRMNEGMSQKKAYKKYIQIIQKNRDSITEYENANDRNSTAFVDINDSGIPDVLYITQDDSESRPYLHCVTDGERDVEVDEEESLTGELDPEYTLFQHKGETTIYIKTKDKLYRLVTGKDDSGKTQLQKEILAQRIYDETTEEYSYFILDSGELKEVTEKEYTVYIASVCDKEITIILTTLSDDELQKEFPHTIEDISEKQDETIKRLKEDIVPVGDSSTPDSAASRSQEATEEKAEEKDRNFVHDHYLVEYDDVVYYADDDGLWKKEADSESEKLVSCSATNLATDGQIIYYGVYNKTVSRTYYSSKIENYQYDMYKYDLITGANEKLMSFVEAGKPICAVGDTVYYTDFPDDFDGNMAGLAQGICSYNTATGEKKYLCDGAHLTASYGGKIFYRQIMAAGGNMGVHQIHCYDTKTQTSKEISEDNVMNFKVIGDKLYYAIITEFGAGTEAASQYKLCCYDIATEETTVLRELEDLKDFDDKYAIGAKQQKIRRFDLSSGEYDLISLSGFIGNDTSVIRDNDTTYCFAGSNTHQTVYAISDDASSADTLGNLRCQYVLAVKDRKAFYIDPSDQNYYFYHIDYQKLN